ncbi:MAG: ArsC/Spx/MgsR family protein [Bacteroidota bacterium]
MKKVYHLSTCTTCQRIIKDLGLKDGFELQDIKVEKITETQLDDMKALAGSYEALFSRVARKYKELGLKEKQLSEDDYKSYILDEYTFLKRPVVIVDEQIFIGNSKKNIESLASAIGA